MPKFYYKSTQNDNATYIDDNDEIHTVPFQKFDLKFSFEMFKGYQQTHEDLKRFKSDMIRENEEIKTFDYDFLSKWDNRKAIMLYFRKKSTISKNRFTFEKINEKEYRYMEACPNGGLTYFDKQYTNVETQCYGYDCKMYYPNLLCDEKLRLPTKAGVEKKITEIPAEFPYGIYKCKVICDDPNIKKMFAFSTKHTYTSISLNNALFLKNKKKYNIHIELDLESEYNALVYDETIGSNAIFKSWLTSVKRMREKYPKNKLIKYMSSSLWGGIIQFNRKTVASYTEVDMNDYIIDDEVMYPDREVIYLLPKKQPYKDEFARLKPFLVALSRYYICNLIIKHKVIDNIIRIQTDGIVLNKEVLWKGDYAPIFEDKSSGLMTWYHVNFNSRIKAERDKKSNFP